MKKIYILLMHTNTIPSKFVKTFTRYEYSHVAISLTKDCDILYSFGRRGLYNIFNGGFCVQDKTGEFFKKFNKTECKIYEVAISDSQFDTIKSKIDEMEIDTNNYKYDFLGIIPRWFNIPVKFENRFVCSTFVADILEQSNVYNFDKENCLVVPKDFETVHIFKPIYEGSYSAYNV